MSTVVLTSKLSKVEGQEGKVADGKGNGVGDIGAEDKEEQSI